MPSRAGIRLSALKGSKPRRRLDPRKSPALLNRGDQLARKSRNQKLRTSLSHPLLEGNRRTFGSITLRLRGKVRHQHSRNCVKD
jgi:hypothetical protein